MPNFKKPCTNPLRVGTELFRFNIVNTSIIDAYAPCVGRASTLVILTILNR